MNTSISEFSTLEELLEYRCQEKFPDFLSKWKVVRDNIVSNLETVSYIFPQYSLHDKSHCEKILSTILKILGKENIDKLSISNVFMLIFSAYTHDLGMAIDKTVLEEALDSESFLRLVKEIQSDPNSEYYKYANLFFEEDKKLKFKNDELNSYTFNAARFLLSFYFRKKHGDMANDKVVKGFCINFTTPTIIYSLGQIIRTHTMDFDEVLKLPYKENGLFDDYYHPQFIACMLRLGDLLDLESDRFSEIQLGTLPNFPMDSEIHKKKHESVRHILITEREIEIEATCNEYEVYDLLNTTFNWIREEISNQMGVWQTIIPESGMNSLPRINKLNIQFNDYDLLLNNKKPRFSINQEKAWSLIQGAGIYKDKETCIRELIQNAVDATLLRFWVELGNDVKKSIDYETVLKKLENECITISLKKICKDKKLQKWKFSIIDNGIGMDKKDLEYLLESASSYKNEFKNRIIDTMPEWLKPSGTFGLGFQSIFMLSDMVYIKSRKLNSSYVILMEGDNPTKSNGKVLLKTEAATFTDKCGTEVSGVFFVENIPSKLSISFDEMDIERQFREFDFISDDSLDIEIFRIIRAIRKYSVACPVKINLIINNERYCLEPIRNTTYKVKFFEKYGVELIIDFENRNFKYQFRNQIIEKDSLGHPRFIEFSANILSGNAKDILKINRDDFQENAYVNQIWNNIIKAGCEYLNDIEVYNSLSDDDKIKASMFLNYYNRDFKILSEIESKWLDYKCPNAKHSFRQIINSKKNILIKIESYSNRYSFGTSENDNSIIIETQFNIPDEIRLLILELKEKERYFSFIEYDNKTSIYSFSRTNSGEVINLENWFKHFLLTGVNFSRVLMPCNDKYLKLRINPNGFYLDMNGVFSFLRYELGDKYPDLMICPYVRKLKEGRFIYSEIVEKDVEKVVELTYERRLAESTTKEEVRNALEQFLCETRELVKKINDENLGGKIW